MSDIEYTDRYRAMGIPYPDPATVCNGQCEGTGLVPIKYDEENEPFATLYLQAHERGCVGIRNRLRELWRHREFWYWRSKLREWCDGWHFVTCPACNGTRVRQPR